LAQESGGPEYSRDTLLAAARMVIDSTRYCTVVTLDEDGSPRIRPMDPFAPEPDMTIWLGTKRDSRKVADIRHNPTIALCYLMPNGMGYVSVYGKAELVDDPAAKEKWWKPEWAMFYPDKDKNYLAIKVTPRKIEVVNYALGVAGDPRTWTPPTIEFGK
jgi:general stress protein 26